MLAERGFDPESGARSLRRAVEDHLVQPLAEILSGRSEDGFSSIEIGLGADGRLEIAGSTFVAAQAVGRRRSLVAREIGDLSSRLDVFLKRVGEELDDWETGDDYAARGQYFFLREELLELRRWRDQLLAEAEFELNPQNANITQRASRFGKQSTRLVVRDLDHETILNRLGKSADPGKILARLAAEAELIPTLSHHAENLIQRANRVQFFFDHREDAEQALQVVAGGNHPIRGRNLPDAEGGVNARTAQVITRYFDTFCEGDLPYMVSANGGTQIIIDHPLAERLLAFERGAQLVYGADGSTHHLQFDFVKEGEAVDVQDAADQTVLRVHHENGFTLDLRTGIIVEDPLVPLWTYINPLLPAAPEFSDF